MSRKQIYILLGLLILVIAGGAAWFLMGNSGSAGVDAAAAGNGPGYVLTPHDRHLGNPHAKIVLIEYGAPSCPVCARFNAETFPQLKQNYIDTGKVYYVFRVFPLRPDDGVAEKLARCLPEDKYFSFIDLLFRNQSKWDVEYGIQEPQGVHDGLILLARIAGMSAEQADKCMNDPALDDTINKVAQDGETRYSISGTPTIVVNGVAQPNDVIVYDNLKKVLDAELAKS